MSQSTLFDTNGRARVVKSNKLILGRADLSPIQHRIVAMLIAQLTPETETFEKQTIRVKDLERLLERSHGSIYQDVEDACSGLLDAKIEVRERGDGRRTYHGMNLMSDIKYKEGGEVKAEFTPAMRPFLLQLKRRFTQYNLQYFVRLSSQYSMRIYELLKMRQDLRFYRIPVQELRELLKCEHSYARFRDFRRATIDRAQKELREKTDIHFNYKVERDGQSPVRICFIIKSDREDQAERELIQREPTSAEDIGVVQTPAEETSASPPSINVYAMILDEMTQDQLDEIDDSTVRDAVDKARASARDDNPDLGEVNVAQIAFTRARSALDL
jgi:plasmid replication initiation protein